MSLLKQLAEKGILAKEKYSSLEFEAKSSGQSEEEFILDRGLAAEDFLFNLKSENLKVPLRKASPEDISLKLLEKIPEESARFYQMVPLNISNSSLDVGMVYPENLKSQEALKFLARQGKFSYKVFLITPTDYQGILKKYRSLRREVGQALEELESEIKSEQIKGRPKTVSDFERLVADAPISKVVAVILRHAVEGKASDIHIEPTRDKLRVRFRLLGALHASIMMPLTVHPAVVARIKILSSLKIDETRIPQDGRFSTKIDDKQIDFRVSTFPTTLGEKVALRVLDSSAGLKTLEQLGLEGRSFRIIKSAIQKPYGLILSTGPTGSGKTTTLYAILQLLNKEDTNIVTLEDPVEYFITGINQSQIRPEIGYDFATGLRHILRQDPNVIMVGEIRDEETAGLSINAALTGHIVLATLHTNDALGVVPRMIDLGVKDYLLPPTLSCALAQRLVRKLCSSCREKVKPKKEILDLILEEISNVPEKSKKDFQIPKSIYIYQPVGCKQCGQAGFSGRIGVFEVLSMTDQLAEIILKEPTEGSIKAEAKRQGMVTMKQDGILKVLAGLTTIEEVLRVAEEK